MKLIRKTSKPVQVENSPVIISDVNGEELLQNVGEDKITIEQILEKAENMQAKCVDTVVPVQFCEVLDIANSPEYRMDFVGTNDESEWQSTFTKYSLAQLGFRYGISSSYIQRCTNAGMKDLMCENFNRWIDKDNGKVLIRRYLNYVRGILSTKYTRYDTNRIIADVAKSPVRDWEVKQYLLSPERFHMRLVSSEFLGVPEEKLQIGLNIDSSDIGRSSLNLQLIIFRQVCSNGLILPYSVSRYFRQVHMGDGAEQFPQRIAAKLEEIPEIKKIAERMIVNTLGKKLPIKLEEENSVVRFRQSYGVTKAFMDKVIELYSNRKYMQNERWNFINCMTEVAQNYGIDSRLQFERAAGNLLESVA